MQRIGTPVERSLENEMIINLMGEIISDLELIKNGKASKAYTKKINEKLNSSCENDTVISKMKELKLF